MSLFKLVLILNTFCIANAKNVLPDINNVKENGDIFPTSSLTHVTKSIIFCIHFMQKIGRIFFLPILSTYVEYQWMDPVLKLSTVIPCQVE